MQTSKTAKSETMNCSNVRNWENKTPRTRIDEWTQTRMKESKLQKCTQVRKYEMKQASFAYNQENNQAIPTRRASKKGGMEANRNDVHK